MYTNTGMGNQTRTENVTDRFDALRKRIIALKSECPDAAFCAYLDQKWMELHGTENALYQLEQSIERGYQQYLAKMSYGPQAHPVQSVFYSPMQERPKPVYHPQLQQRAVQTQAVQTQAAQAQVVPVPQPAYKQPAPDPLRENPQKSMEFKVGTIIFGAVGIIFLLIAFITFGLNFMNSILQGIFLYVIGVALIVLSERFVFKRFEKFSGCLTGLGISSLYAVTLLNYIYLAIFPAWAALLITIALTAFFFYLSRKKDSGMIRIICLIGCYLSLAPIHQMKNQLEFLMPAMVIFLVNLAGVYCPLKKRQKIVDYIQYICSVLVIFHLIHLQWLSGLQMWPVYILVCANMLTLHLLYHRTKEEAGCRVLYFLGQSVHMGCLLYIGYHEEWLHFGVIGVLALCGALTALLFKKSIRFAPYLFTAAYSILAYFIDGQSFWLSLACLLVFAVNKGCVRFFKEFPVPDAVYTMFSAIGVCLFMRRDDLQLLGYTYAACILISCCFMKKFHKYHIFTALTFGWLFLLTEDCEAFLCSILLCTLAAAAIGAGFYRKNKGVRIYGLVLAIFVSLKLVVFDFHGFSAQIRILVFFIVGLLILGISFGYIYLEKGLNEEARRMEEKRLNEAAKSPAEEEGIQFMPWMQEGGQEKEQENMTPALKGKNNSH